MKELDLNEKLSRIQQEFKSKKSKFNSFGKYYFRSAEDILEALKPMNEKYGVYFLIKEKVSWKFNNRIKSVYLRHQRHKSLECNCNCRC